MTKPPTISSTQPQVFDPQDTATSTDMKITVDASCCPLCGGGNRCLPSKMGVSGKDIPEGACWCADPNLRFPEALLQQVPEHLRRKACICKTCVENYWRENQSEGMDK